MFTFIMDSSRVDRPVRQSDRFRELAETLSSPRRRAILAVLEDTDASSVRKLATRLVDVERDRDGDVSDRRRETVVSLAHVHLPWLDDRGLVDWDRESGAVALTDAARGGDFELLERVAVAVTDGESPVDDR